MVKKKFGVGKLICDADKNVSGFVFKEFDDYILFGRRGVKKK